MLVTILSAVKNEERYIQEAIDSVLSQTYQSFELILIDDSSTDNTLSIIKGYEKENDKVKVFSNSGKGKVSAYNLGYEKSSGDLFVYFAGDDILPRNSIELRVSKIRDKRSEEHTSELQSH